MRSAVAVAATVMVLSVAGESATSPRPAGGAVRPVLLTARSGLGDYAPERRPATSSQTPYWTKEFRRRWRLELLRRHNRERTIRRLRRTLAVRARAREVIGGVWLALASCESGRRWDYNGPSGFDGGLQFHPGTWSAYRPPGFPAFAYLASPGQQVDVARRVLAAQGWQAWPACT